MKKTIAIIGATEELGRKLAVHLAAAPASLLLISSRQDLLLALRSQISAASPEAVIDAMDCIKDGCWEADIIILAVSPHAITDVVKKMKQVATRKIVVVLREYPKNGEKDKMETLEELLPYSCIVYVSGIDASGKISLEGKNDDAIKEIEGLFRMAGFSF